MKQRIENQWNQVGSMKRSSKLSKHKLCLPRKREKIQITSRKWKRGYFANCTYIKRIIKQFYEQLYANKLDNFDKTEKFLERQKNQNWLKNKWKFLIDP